jgi:hypothetical protein
MYVIARYAQSHHGHFASVINNMEDQGIGTYTREWSGYLPQEQHHDFTGYVSRLKFMTRIIFKSHEF